ncbi:MAG: hypothetical protein HUU02_13920 [Bacteroidetes bacterium]|nr:hypothetical protein [Bacteroidota bacterium]
MRQFLLIVLLLGIQTAAGQFKPKAGEQPRVADSFIQPTASEWFSLFNPNNFQMRHSYSASYSTSGGQGIALQRYTNTMIYQFSPTLDARVDLSLQNSPYSTFEYRLQNQFSKAYVSRAELNYRPTENTVISLQYRELPFNYYGYGYQRPFGGVFYGLDQYED